MNKQDKSQNLLLSYAFDNEGNEIHIDNAIKGQKYFCPICGGELILRISNIPKGQKYHRKNHFAHKTGSVNNCSESYLHKRTKQKLVVLIREKISSESKELTFGWHCDECGEYHKGNLIKKAVNIIEEYDLGTCRPDIALLDKDGKVVIVIEVVVTHEPETEVLSYYADNKIACLQLVVHDFEDCDDLEKRLLSINKVNMCPNRICPKCGRRMNHIDMGVMTIPCWRCGNDMKIAMIRSHTNYPSLFPSQFSIEEIEIAQQHGVCIQKRYSQTMKQTYYANTCPKCNAFIGDFFKHEYDYEKLDITIELKGFKCFSCLHDFM